MYVNSNILSYGSFTIVIYDSKGADEVEITEHQQTFDC